jgi:hypothetical protein
MLEAVSSRMRLIFGSATMTMGLSSEWPMESVAIC